MTATTRRAWLTVLTGAGWILLLAFADPDLHSPGSVVLLVPVPGWPATPDAAVPVVQKEGGLSVQVTADGIDDCELRSEGDRVSLSNGRTNAILGVGPVDHRRLAWFETVCAGQVDARAARVVQPAERGDGARSDEAEVVRLRIERPALQDEVERVLPALLQEQLQGWLDQKRRRPPRLVRIDVADVQVHRVSATLDGARVRLDVDLEVAIEGGLRVWGTPSLSFRDRFPTATATVDLRRWPRVRVDGVRLDGRACDQLEGTAARGCTAVTRWLYGALAARLEEELARELSRRAGEVDFEALLGEGLVRWARAVHLFERAETLAEEAGLRVSNAGVAPDGSYEVALSASRDWLGPGGADGLTVADTSAPVDLAVSTSALNRLSEELFRRPIGDVLGHLDDVARAAGWKDQLDAAATRLGPGGAGGELQSLLDLVGVELDPEAVVLPQVRVDGTGTPTVWFADARLLRSVGGTEALSLSAEARLVEGRDDRGLVLRPDPEHLLTHVAVEAVAADPARRGSRTSLRLRAVSDFAQEQLERTRGAIDEEPLIGEDAVDAFLRAVPSVPTRLRAGRISIEATSVGGDEEGQSLVLGGRLRLE